MIRLATQADIPQLHSLWTEAFGDDPQTIDLFLRERFSPENTLVWDSDGAAASVLYLLPCTLQTAAGQALTAYYIFAACTAQNHRGQGHMGALLDYAKTLATQRGMDFLSLAPAQESLFDYYARFGFRRAFTRKQLFVSRRQLRLMSRLGAAEYSPAAEESASLRARVYGGTDYLSWDADALRFAQHFQTNCVHCAIDGAYHAFALFEEENEKCIVSECCTSGQDFPLLAGLLLTKTARDVFFFCVPLRFPLTADRFDVHENGMLLALNPKAEQVQAALQNAYLGLTME